MHHLINELRPHQARESIRVLMQSQKRQRFDTTVRLNKQIERVNDLMSSAINSITEQTPNPSIDLKQTLSEMTSLNKDINSDEMKDQNYGSDTTLRDDSYQLDALMCDFVDDI